MNELGNTETGAVKFGTSLENFASEDTNVCRYISVEVGSGDIFEVSICMLPDKILDDWLAPNMNELSNTETGVVEFGITLENFGSEDTNVCRYISVGVG